MTANALRLLEPRGRGGAHRRPWSKPALPAGLSVYCTVPSAFGHRLVGGGQHAVHVLDIRHLQRAGGLLQETASRKLLGLPAYRPAARRRRVRWLINYRRARCGAYFQADPRGDRTRCADTSASRRLDLADAGRPGLAGVAGVTLDAIARRVCSRLSAAAAALGQRTAHAGRGRRKIRNAQRRSRPCLKSLVWRRGGRIEHAGQRLAVGGAQPRVGNGPSARCRRWPRSSFRRAAP